jgi:hypothetical protein
VIYFKTPLCCRAGLENRDHGRSDLLCWPRNTLCPQKLALNLLISGGRSVGIVRSRTKAIELVLFLCYYAAGSTHWNGTEQVWGSKLGNKMRQEIFSCRLLKTFHVTSLKTFTWVKNKCLEGFQFECWPKHWLSWLMFIVVLSRSSWPTLWKHVKLFWGFSSIHFIIHYHPIIWCCIVEVEVKKLYTNKCLKTAEILM